MSNEERNEYMRNVKWATAKSTAVSAASILLAIAGAYWGLKYDIKDSRTYAHNELVAAVDSITLHEERTQHKNDMQFQAIWNELKSKPNPIKVIYRTLPSVSSGFYTQHRDNNGNLSFQPIN